MSKKAQPQATTQQRKGWLGWMKELAILLLLTIVVGWGIDLWRSQKMASGAAPEIIAQSVYGETLDLSAMSQEQPVMVYFWATWCSVCNTVSPSVDLISDHYQVVTIALTSGRNERLQQYLNAKEYSFDVVNDPKAEISRRWGVSVTPTIFVIDKGEISSVTTGFTSPMGMWLRLLFA